MTIPRKRRGSFGYYDIEDQEAYEERAARRALSHSLAYQWRIRSLDRRSRDQQYSDLRSKGLSGLRAFVASYDRMPSKGYKKKPQGIGAKYRAAKKRRNYGATPSFNKALVAAVKKVEAKSHETFYTDFGINFNSMTNQAGGTFTPGGFQSIVGATGNTANAVFGNPSMVHVISLSAQVQTSSTGVAGYRRGQFINPLGFQWWWRGFLQNMTNQHTFHFVIARYKGTQSSLTGGGAYPVMMSMSQTALFETGSFGPNSSAFNAQNQEYQSGSRFNRDAWDIKTHRTFRVNPPPQLEIGNPALVYRAPIKFDGYYKFKEAQWDYVANNGNVIKGGEYYMLTWQESSEPAQSTASGAPVPWVFMQLNMEMSFKDA